MICQKKMLLCLLFGVISFLVGCGPTPQTDAAEACSCMGAALESEADDWEKEMDKCTKMSKKFLEKYSVNKKQVKEYKEAVLQCSEGPLKDKKWRGGPPI